MSLMGFFAGQKSTPPPSMVLLLHGDGANGSTTITDKSLYARTLTAGGSVALTTGRFKFGTACIDLSNTAAATVISTPDDGGFTFGSGSWTVDFWMQFIGGSSSPLLLGKWRTASGARSWALFYQGGIFYVSRSVNGSTSNDDIAATTSFSSNTWYHIAVDYDSNAPKLRLYKDGVMIGSSTTPRTLSAAGGEPLVLGGSADLSNPNRFYGYLDEVRINKGVALYASDGGFTPPVAPYTDP